MTPAQLAQQMEKTAQALERGPLQPLYPDLLALALEGVQLNFERQQSPDGRPWPPVQHGGRALQQTGQLQGSNSVAMEDNQVAVTNSAPYAAYHQYGTRHIPARPFLGIPADVVARMEERIQAFVGELLEGK